MILTGRVKTEYPALQLRACYLNDLLRIEAHIAGHKTYASGVACVVVEEGVCLQQRGGDFARTPEPCPRAALLAPHPGDVSPSYRKSDDTLRWLRCGQDRGCMPRARADFSGRGGHVPQALAHGHGDISRGVAGVSFRQPGLPA